MGICGCTSKDIPIVPNKFTFDIDNNERANIQIKVNIVIHQLKEIQLM